MGTGAPGWTGKSVVLALASQAGVGELPVLPHLDEGRRAALSFIAPALAQPKARAGPAPVAL
jgi:hypothetical protein